LNIILREILDPRDEVSRECRKLSNDYSLLLVFSGLLISVKLGLIGSYGRDKKCIQNFGEEASWKQPV
jgi:hypothetical protein